MNSTRRRAGSSISASGTRRDGRFEGIAIAGRRVLHMITSRGRIHSFRERPMARTSASTFDAGMRCGIEGLLICRLNPVIAKAHARATCAIMFRSISGGRAPETPAAPWLSIPAADLTARTGREGFSPLDEIDPSAGILRGNDGAFAKCHVGRSSPRAGPSSAAEGSPSAPMAAAHFNEGAGGQAALSLLAPHDDTVPRRARGSRRFSSPSRPRTRSRPTVIERVVSIDVLKPRKYLDMLRTAQRY